jgi:hypothetical protein
MTRGGTYVWRRKPWPGSSQHRKSQTSIAGVRRESSRDWSPGKNTWLTANAVSRRTMLGAGIIKSRQYNSTVIKEVQKTDSSACQWWVKNRRWRVKALWIYSLISLLALFLVFCKDVEQKICSWSGYGEGGPLLTRYWCVWMSRCRETIWTKYSYLCGHGFCRTQMSVE